MKPKQKGIGEEEMDSYQEESGVTVLIKKKWEKMYGFLRDLQWKNNSCRYKHLQVAKNNFMDINNEWQCFKRHNERILPETRRYHEKHTARRELIIKELNSRI